MKLLLHRHLDHDAPLLVLRHYPATVRDFWRLLLPVPDTAQLLCVHSRGICLGKRWKGVSGLRYNERYPGFKQVDKQSGAIISADGQTADPHPRSTPCSISAGIAENPCPRLKLSSAREPGPRTSPQPLSPSPFIYT